MMRKSLFASVFIFMAFGHANGQWKRVYETGYSHFMGLRYELNGMKFFGRDSGVVITDTVIYGISDTVVLTITAITTDGGNTWHENKSNIAKNGIYGNVSATDVNHIWDARGQFIYQTTDGGKNWETYTNQDSVGTKVSSIYFIDSLTGFEGGGGMTMHRTSDGGKTWQLVHHSETDSMYYPIYYISFSTPMLGIATTYDIGTWVLRTTDGGFNWIFTTDIHSGVGNRSYGLSYSDPSNVFFPELRAFHHSTDSGKTWIWIDPKPPFPGYFSAIAFVDSLHGVASGRNPARDSLVLGYTSDAGNTWRTIWIDSSAGGKSGFFNFAAFPNPSVAYIGGSNAVFRLSTADLAVQESPLVSDGVKIEIEAGKLLIMMPNEHGDRLNIFDILGREVSRGVIPPDGSLKLDVSTLQSGIYFVSTGNWFGKFAKE